MTKLLTLFLQTLIVVSLALPFPTAAPSGGKTLAAEATPCDLACCGPACPCPTGKFCSVTPAPAGDRTLTLAQPEVPQRNIASIHALRIELKSFLLKPALLSKADARPPPWASGSPPQARLRVWLI